MRILMMLTAGHKERPSRALGLEQLVESYYLLQGAGVEVVVVSRMGGDPPFRGARKRSARSIATLERFHNDFRAREAFSDTLRFAQVYPEDFDGGICIGALETGAGDDPSTPLDLLTTLLAAGKPVAIVPEDPRLTREAPLEGFLITGDQARSPRRAAKALLAALRPRPR
jgi:hypothetical protein